MVPFHGQSFLQGKTEVKCHSARVDIYNNNNNVVFTATIRSKDSPAWLAWVATTAPMTHQFDTSQPPDKRPTFSLSLSQTFKTGNASAAEKLFMQMRLKMCKFNGVPRAYTQKAFETLRSPDFFDIWFLRTFLCFSRFTLQINLFSQSHLYYKIFTKIKYFYVAGASEIQI